MTRIFKKIFYGIISFALALWVVIAGFFPAVLPISANADTVVAYEQTNVMDDLKQSTIEGKPFSLTDYSFNAFKETKVLSFVEYCYSFYENRQDSYGLYIYVYTMVKNDAQYTFVAIDENTIYDENSKHLLTRRVDGG